MMQDSLQKKDKPSGYNKIYRNQWTTHVNALPMSAIEVMDSLCKKKYGWHFIPPRNMNYAEDDWYKNQTLVLSFESKIDLLVSKLTVTLN